MKGIPKILIIFTLLFLLILPVAAEVHWIQTNVDGVLVTVSSAAGTVGSGQTSYDSTAGTYAIMMEVPPGMYTITGEKAGYITQTESANVVAGWTGTTNLVMTTVPRRGTLVVSTNICDASVSYTTYDKTVTGFGTTTPLWPGTYPCYYRTDLAAGVTYEVTAYVAGYGRGVREVTILPDQENLVAFTLEPESVVPTPTITRGMRTITLDVYPRTSQVDYCLTDEYGLWETIDPAIRTDADKTRCNRIDKFSEPTDIGLGSGYYLEITASKPGYTSQTAKLRYSADMPRTITLTLQRPGLITGEEKTAIEMALEPTIPPTPGRTISAAAVPTVTTTEAAAPAPTRRHEAVLTRETTSAEGRAPLETITPVTTMESPSPSPDLIGGLLRFFGGFFGGR